MIAYRFRICWYFTFVDFKFQTVFFYLFTDWFIDLFVDVCMLYMLILLDTCFGLTSRLLSSASVLKYKNFHKGFWMIWLLNKQHALFTPVTDVMDVREHRRLCGAERRWDGVAVCVRGRRGGCLTKEKRGNGRARAREGNEVWNPRSPPTRTPDDGRKSERSVRVRESETGVRVWERVWTRIWTPTSDWRSFGVCETWTHRAEREVHRRWVIWAIRGTDLWHL